MSTVTTGINVLLPVVPALTTPLVKFTVGTVVVPATVNVLDPMLVTLLLNVVQSADDRQPAREPLAVAQVSDDANEPMTEIGFEMERAPEAVRVVVATEPMVEGVPTPVQ